MNSLTLDNPKYRRVVHRVLATTPLAPVASLAADVGLEQAFRAIESRQAESGVGRSPFMHDYKLLTRVMHGAYFYEHWRRHSLQRRMLKPLVVVAEEVGVDVIEALTCVKLFARHVPTIFYDLAP